MYDEQAYTEQVFVVGIITDFQPPHCSKRSIGNEFNGINERQLSCSYQPHKNAWKRVYDYTLAHMDQIYIHWQYDTITFDDWNQRPTFSAQKRLRHLKAKEKLGVQDIGPKDYYRKAFIKMELLNHDEPYAVRLISGCSDIYNIVFGPPIYAFSKALANCWNENHWLLYTSGKTSETISTWLENQLQRLQLTEANWAFICADESRQDAHVSKDAKIFEHKLFEKLGVPGDITYLLRNTLKTTGYSQFGLKYNRVGGRDTGTPETSSGNSQMNAIKILNFLHTYLPTFDYAKPPFCVCIQGDDSLVAINRSFLSQRLSDMMIEHSKSLGFKIKYVKITQNLYDVDYCSRYFWPTDNHSFGYVLAPKIGKVLAKIGYSRTKVIDYMRHNKGIAMGLALPVSNVPFLHEWQLKMAHLTRSTPEVEIPVDYSIRNSQYHNYTDETWEVLYHHYGLTQLDLTEFIRSLEMVNSLPFKIPFPGDARKILQHDQE